jgi:bifunctional non-homologous end joining protein LigD
VPEKPPLQLARRLDEDGLAALQGRAPRPEGLVAKRLDSVYRSGIRPAWLKVKVRQEDEFVIGGFTKPAGSRQHFGALLVGPGAGRLRYAGKVGNGFTTRTLADLMARFAPLVRATSPFHEPPRERHVTWLEPRLVAQLAYTELTEDGRLRHPVFLGLRADKAARKVHWPRPAHAPRP